MNLEVEVVAFKVFIETIIRSLQALQNVKSLLIARKRRLSGPRWTTELQVVGCTSILKWLLLKVFTETFILPSVVQVQSLQVAKMRNPYLQHAKMCNTKTSGIVIG